MPKRRSDSEFSNQVNFRFGARLRRARELRGITQQELGQALGVTFQQVQKYESGKTNINLDRLLSAAKFLKLPASSLIFELDNLDIDFHVVDYHSAML
jgi:transcriptional regulator with XRE-family HTH domain